jgi:hypothetical protein
MSPLRSIAVFGLTLGLLLVGAVSCDRSKPENPEISTAVVLQKAADGLRNAGGAPGFICGINRDGGITCICDDNAPPGSIESCEGMERICGLLGTGSICRPETGWCICKERH